MLIVKKIKIKSKNESKNKNNNEEFIEVIKQNGSV